MPHHAGATRGGGRIEEKKIQKDRRRVTQNPFQYFILLIVCDGDDCWISMDLGADGIDVKRCTACGSILVVGRIGCRLQNKE
jgi:hypothetical protein